MVLDHHDYFYYFCLFYASLGRSTPVGINRCFPFPAVPVPPVHYNLIVFFVRKSSFELALELGKGPANNNKVSAVRTGQQTFTADKVVIASGAWSAQFKVTRSSVDVIPVKGQMVMYKGEPGQVKRIILSGGHYVIPRKDGRILAGSTLEKIGFDKTVSSAAFDELHQAAVQLVPLIEDLPVERQWAGLRPGTEKGIPYICQHDDIEGLYIHAGHFRNGIVLGAASAELMIDIILGRQPWCDVRPYSMCAQH